MSNDRPEPRHRRSQDDPRLRRHRAEPGAAEAAAAADRRRHPRRRARRLERLEGPAAAHALLRDRAAGRRRPHAGRRAASASPRRRPRCAPRSPTGRADEVERFIDRHYPDYWLRTETQQAASSTPSCCAAPRRRASTLATDFTHRRLHRHHRADRRSRPTIRACWRCSPAPAPPPAPTSSARTSRRRATASRSTPSCSQREFERRRGRAAPRASASRETIERLLKGEVRLDALLAKRRAAPRPHRGLHGRAGGA